MRFIKFLRSVEFATFVMIIASLLEGIFSYYVFSKTTIDSFGKNGAVIFGFLYSFIGAAAIIVFTLRNNRFMVWFFLIYETMLNGFLDYLFVYENNTGYFWMQLFIGTMIPFATKFFADEISKDLKKIDSKELVNLQKIKHPKNWFIERVGKEVLRNKILETDVDDIVVVKIDTKVHAEHIYKQQIELENLYYWENIKI